jgi:hypothetical protein
MSNKNLEQRINIKFYVKIGGLWLIQYEEIGRSEWPRRFKEGRKDVKDDPRSGQPKTQ